MCRHDVVLPFCSRATVSVCVCFDFCSFIGHAYTSIDTYLHGGSTGENNFTIILFVVNMCALINQSSLRVAECAEIRLNENVVLGHERWLVFWCVCVWQTVSWQGILAIVSYQRRVWVQEMYVNNYYNKLQHTNHERPHTHWAVVVDALRALHTNLIRFN